MIAWTVLNQCATNFHPPGGTPYIWMIGMIVVFFKGCNRRFGILWGLFKQNPLKRQNWYLLGYKNSSFECASFINSCLLVFFRLIFDQEVYFRVRKFYGLVFFRVFF